MKRRLQQCLLFVASFVLLSTSLSILSLDKAQAASQYDNVIKTTDTGVIRCSSTTTGLNTGDTEDLKINWSQVINSNNTEYNSRTINRYYGSISHSDVWTTLQSRLNEGSGWTVAMLDEDPTYGNTMRISIAKNTDQPYFAQLFGSSDWNVLQYDNAYTLDIRCVEDYLHVDATEGSAIVQREGNANLKLLLAAAEITYPTGYEGLYPSATNEPSVYPEVMYNVDNYDLSAFQNADQFPELGGNYKVKWTLYDHDSTDMLLEFVGDSPYEEFVYTFDEYGVYGLDVSLEWAGIPYEGIPDNIKTRRLHINVDGSSYISGTGKDQCDNTGYCAPASPYEDCSTYGTDIIGGIGCAFRNFGVFLRQLLTSLFVPSKQFLTTYWNTFQSKMNESLGFIYQSIALMISSLTGVISAAATSDCTFNPEGQMYGANLNLNMCKFASVYPFGWTVLQSLMIGLTVISLIFAFNRKYHEVVDQR